MDKTDPLYIARFLMDSYSGEPIDALGHCTLCGGITPRHHPSCPWPDLHALYLAECEPNTNDLL